MAAGATYEPIQTTTLSSNSSVGISFNSFSGYTDLVLIINGTQSVADDIKLVFNSDSGSNYSRIGVYWNSSVRDAFGTNNNTSILCGDLPASGLNGTVMVNIFNYSSNNIYKTCHATNRLASQSQIRACTWRNTNAITTIDVTVNQGVFYSGTSFTLYGILAA